MKKIFLIICAFISVTIMSGMEAPHVRRLASMGASPVTQILNKRTNKKNTKDYDSLTSFEYESERRFNLREQDSPEVKRLRVVVSMRPRSSTI